jgi:aldehyde:ferredoxin oxidoreductase
VRQLPHIKKLDDSFGEFYIDVVCPCGNSTAKQIEELQKLAGKSATFEYLKTRLKCDKCGARNATLTARAKPRPRRRDWR